MELSNCRRIARPETRAGGVGFKYDGGSTRRKLTARRSLQAPFAPQAPASYLAKRGEPSRQASQAASWFESEQAPGPTLSVQVPEFCRLPTAGTPLFGAAPYSCSLYWILRTLMPSTSAALLVDPP